MCITFNGYRRQLIRTLCIGAWIVGCACHPLNAIAKEKILVYTAIEPEWLPVYKKAFESQYPDIEVTYVRASAGPISARLLAEKDNPQADAVLGLSAIALENLRKKGLLEPYRPVNAEKLNAKMHAQDFSWFGMNAWGGSICVNTDLLE